MSRGREAYYLPDEGHWFLQQAERRDGKDWYYPCSEEVARAALIGVALEETKPEAPIEVGIVPTQAPVEPVRRIGAVASTQTTVARRLSVVKAA